MLINTELKFTTKSMMLHSYHPILLLCMLIFCADSSSAVYCHQCEPMKLDYIVTVDNFPSLGNCSVVTTERYCLAAIIWLLNGTSEVLYYPFNTSLTFERVNILVGRNASGAAQYSGERLIDYRCSSSDIPCDTPENLKRVLTATTFPSDDQINQLNTKGPQEIEVIPV